MHADLDTLVIALYCTVDDLLPKRAGAGRPPRLSDAELVCLATAQVLLGARSEHHWLRQARTQLGHLFPYLPQQPGYNTRLRALARHVCQVIEHLAQTSPSWCDQWRLLDATPIPCGASVQTRKRSALRGWADYGYCASHSRWYWGVKLYLLAAPDGMPIAWCLAPPTLGERAVSDELLALAWLRAGTVVVADKGLAGERFEQQVGGHGARLVRPDRADEPHRFGNLGGVRQWIEAIFGTLKEQLGLEQHRGRTVQGVFVRVAQRLLALATVVWFNWQAGIEPRRCLALYDHC